MKVLGTKFFGHDSSLVYLDIKNSIFMLNYIINEKKISNFVVDLVFELGSETVFTLTGGMAMFINNAVATHPKLKSVYCHHEQACVAAAVPGS